MTIHILTTNKNGKIEIDPKELTELLNQAYQEGKDSTTPYYHYYINSGPYTYTTARGIEYNPLYSTTTTGDNITINCADNTTTKSYSTNVDLKTNLTTSCDR